MSKLQLIQPTEKTGVLVVPMENKNELALALENTKIRDYQPEQREINTKKMVLYLLNLLGVKGSESTTPHHVICTKFIEKNLKHYTYQEIELAFEKYVLGEFYDSKGQKMLVTQQLNAVVLGNVMNCYSELKTNELDAYRSERNKQIVEARNKSEELSDQEKSDLIRSGVVTCFDHYSQHNEIKSGYLYVYDVLFDKGLLESEIEEKKRIYKLAVSRVNREVKSKRPTTFAERNDIKHLIEKAKNNLLIDKYKAEAQSISLSMFFQSIVDSNSKQITDFI